MQYKLFFYVVNAKYIEKPVMTFQHNFVTAEPISLEISADISENVYI